MWKEVVVTCFEILSQHSPNGNEETHEYPGRMVCVPADIHTEYLLNTDQKRYRLSQLAFSH
jgi:hypothetical protein